MTIFDLIEFSIGFIIGAVNVLLLTFWLTVLIYRLNTTLKKYKHYRNDSHLCSEILYALETVRNRDIFLIILTMLEMAYFFCFTLVIPQMNINIYKSEFANSTIQEEFPNCSILPIFAFSYIYPANTFMIITFGMMIITQFMLISFLNSYLAVRYFGYSLPRKVIYKYIFWWIFQYSIQTICIIPKLLVFLLPICVLFVFLDWFNIILSSRNMSRAIRSKLKEIRLFEWNPNNYRILSKSLKYYKWAMSVFILSFSLSILSLAILSTYFLLHLFASDCFFKTVYGIHFHVNINHSVNHHVNEILNAFPVVLGIINGIMLFLPSLVLFLLYAVNLIYNRCTGKGSLNRINNELFEPLVNH